MNVHTVSLHGRGKVSWGCRGCLGGGTHRTESDGGRVHESYNSKVSASYDSDYGFEQMLDLVYFPRKEAGGDASLGSGAAGGAGGGGTLQSPQKKTLVKYDPNSKRNRMPVYFGVEAQQGVRMCRMGERTRSVINMANDGMGVAGRDRGYSHDFGSACNVLGTPTLSTGGGNISGGRTAASTASPSRVVSRNARGGLSRAQAKSTGRLVQIH